MTSRSPRGSPCDSCCLMIGWCLFRGLVLFFPSSLDWFNQEDATASVWKGCFNVSPRSSLLVHQEGPFRWCYRVTTLEWPRIKWHSWRITRTSKWNSNEPLPHLTTFSNIGGNIKNREYVCLCRIIIIVLLFRQKCPVKTERGGSKEFGNGIFPSALALDPSL